MDKENKNHLELFSKLFSKLQGKETSGQRAAGAKLQKSAVPELKLIFFIVDWNRAAVISKVLVEEKVSFHFLSRGRGTASSEVLDLLGIGASDKAIILCIEQPAMVPFLMKQVRGKLDFRSPGAGIAFTVPLSGINAPIMQLFTRRDTSKIPVDAVPLDRRLFGTDRRRANRTNEFTNHLVIAVTNKGYSGELMNNAREAGAAGGTVLNARGQAVEGELKVFGISVQAEKEVVIILVRGGNKKPIMEAICKTHGPDSNARGIVLSLPVENVMGLIYE